MTWHQARISLPAFPRGVHLVTQHILRGMPKIAEIETGLLHVFILHTSASLTINENADPDVRTDMEMSLNRLAPENAPYVHTLEGPDDMPAHVKASLMGAGVLVPVSRGQLVLGTWQGIYLCEHRDRGGARSLVLTLQGEAR